MRTDATAVTSRHHSHRSSYGQRLVNDAARLRKKDILRRCLAYFPFGLIVWLCAGQLLASPQRLLSSLLLLSSSSNSRSSSSSVIQERRQDNQPWSFPVSNNKERNLSLLVAQYAAAPLSFVGSSSNKIKSSNETAVNSSIYDELLQLTSPINQAYCRAWKCDYWIVRGIPFQMNDELVTERLVVDGRIIHRAISATVNPPIASHETIPASRSTYNKVAILEMALWHNRQQQQQHNASSASTASVTKYYDRLLLLDADAMLYDFDRDIATAVPDNIIFTAHRTHHPTNTTTTTTTDMTLSTNISAGSINVGVTVWNLRHPQTPFLVQVWKKQCLKRIRERKHDDDQAPLQKLLQQLPNDKQRNRVVYAVTDELGYAKGRWVRHFIRRSNAWHDIDNNINTNQTNSTNNNNTALRGEERKAQLSRAVSEVCQRYWPVCEPDDEEIRMVSEAAPMDISPVNGTTSTGSP